MTAQSRSSLRSVLVGVALAAGLLGGGCKGMRDALINQSTNSPQYDKKIQDSGRTACIAAWQKKLPNQSAKLEAEMNSFCDCISIRTSQTFSHAELTQLGVMGPESKTPAQKAKTAENIKVCEEQAGIK